MTNSPARRIRIAFLGFGSVNEALHALLARRDAELRAQFGVESTVTGIASRRLGWVANRAGLAPGSPSGLRCAGVHDWLEATGADVLFEAIALDPFTGQPALDYIRASLAAGAHVVSANKGAVVHGFRELAALAADRGRAYRFEAAVMDGAPVFSLLRRCLPLAGLHAIRGVFTSTSTIVLEAVERGLSFGEGVAEAQRMGIAEANPAFDLDGWDSAVKLCALAHVVFGGDLRPGDVTREGISGLSERAIRDARADGNPLRLVGHVARDAHGGVSASVAPMAMPGDGVLGVVTGTTLAMHYEADVFPGGLTVTSRHPDPTTTAYGMLSDYISVIAG